MFKELAKGNPEAFLAIFQTSSDKFYTFAFKITRSKELAEEIVQDVYLNLWLNRHKISDIRNMEAYLNRITRNLSLNVLRDIAKDRLLIRDLTPEDLFPDDSTQQYLDYQDTLGLMNVAIAKLPGQQREVYKLCRTEGLTYEEAAKVLQIAPSTVHSHMKEALKSIRGHFKKMEIPMAIIMILFP